MTDELQRLKDENARLAKEIEEAWKPQWLKFSAEYADYKKRAEAAEFSLDVCRDECAALRQNEMILAEQAYPAGVLR